MPVSDTRLRISLVDDATGGLRSLTSQYDKFNQSIADSGKGYNSVATSSQTATNALDQQGKSLEKVDAMMQRVAYSAARYLVIYKGFAALGNIWDTVISGSFEYQKMLETNKLGMSGILMSMTEINGEALTFDQAMGVSSQIMKKLTDESLRTSVNVTDMVETFRGLLGPGLGAGMKIDEIVKLTSVGVTAVKSLGLPQNQLLQELRGMVQGGIKPASSTLATALGLKDADIKAAKASSEGLFAFLMNRLQGFNSIAGERANTFEGRIERLKLGIQLAMGGGGENIFNTASSEIGKIADKFFIIEKSTTETGKEINVIKGLNPDIVSSISAVSERVLRLCSDLKDIGTTLMPAIKVGASLFANTLDVVLKNVKTIAASFALWKVYGVARDLVSVQTATENGYVATTTLGQGFQDIKNKLNTFNGELRITGELQNSLNETAQKYSSIGITQGNVVSNLSEKYTAMGLSAKEANTLQISVLETLYEHGVKAAQAVQAAADEYAKYNRQLQLTTQYQHEAGAGIVAAPGLVQGEVNNAQADYNNIANSKRVEESVTRIAQRYQELGISVQEAGAIQARIQALVLAGNEEQARSEMALHDTLIKTKQLRNEELVSENERFRNVIANINTEYAEQVKLNKAKKYVQDVIRQTSASNSQYADSISMIIDYLKELGMEESKVYQYATIQARALKQGHTDIVTELGGEIVKHAEEELAISKTVYTQKQLNALQKEYLSTDYSKLTEQQKQLLDFDTETILQKTKEIDLVATIRGAYESLNSAVNDGMLSQQEANATLVELQKQVVAGNVDIAASIGNEITLRYQQGTLAADNAQKTIANGEEEAAIRQRINDLLKTGVTAQAELAASNAINATGNKELANSYGSMVVRIRDIIAEMQRKGIVAAEVEKLYVELLTKSTIATEAEMSAIVKDTNAALAKYEAQMKLNGGLSVGISSMGKWASRISIASMALVGLTGETDSWVNSAANFVFQAGFVASALEGINVKLDATIIKAGLAKAALLGVVAAGGAAIAYAGIEAGKKLRDLLGQDKVDTTTTNVNQNMWETGMPQGTTTVTNPNADAQATRDQYSSTNVADFKKLDAKSMDTLSDLIDKLQKKNFGSETDTGTGAGGKSSEDKEAKKLAEEQKKAEALEKANREFIAKTAEGYAADAEAFGHDGCTAFVDACLNSTDLNDLFDGLGRDVGNAWVKASERGIAQSADLQGVLANAQRGDVIFYSSDNNPTGQHVGVYDGEGGVWHNASTADRGDGKGPRVSHANVDIGGGLQIMGFASVGGTKVNGADTTQQMTKYQAILGKYQTSLADITKEINSNKQAYSDEDTIIQAYLGVMDNANKKSAEYADTMARAAAIGIDTTRMKTKLDEYNKIMQEAATRAVRAAKDSNLQYATDEASRIVALNEGTTDDMNKELSKRLSDHQIYLENILTKENLSKDERAKYEQELTQVIAQEEEIRKTTIEGSVQNISKTLRNYVNDYESIFTNVQDSVSSSFDGLFDGIITGQNNFVDNVHNAWNDIANTVMNAVWKMAMQMLVVKPLFNWLGGLFGGGLTIGGSTLTQGTTIGGQSFYSGAVDESSLLSGLGFAANGGEKQGWTVVGEHGPELVDFASPSRVYTASQTANALSGNGGLKDVKVEIVNKTSQEVKATSSNVSFDAKGYIIQVVLEAVSKNTNGTRDALKGAVANY